jgi:hypothetical protein
MALTYKAIDTVTVGSGGISAITFQNIPSTYDDLAVYVSVRSDRSDNTGATAFFWKFNNTTSNRTSHRWYSVGGNAKGSDSAGGVAGIIPGSLTATGAFGLMRMYIPDYANTSRGKGLIVDSFAPGDSANYEDDAQAGYWDDTSAINRIDFYMNATGNIVQHSTATLIGIKKS